MYRIAMAARVTQQVERLLAKEASKTLPGGLVPTVSADPQKGIE